MSNNRPPQTPAGLHLLSNRQKTIIFGTILGAVFMSTLDVTIVATALPSIVTDLGGFQEYAFVATSYLIGTVIAIPIVGKLTDIHGRKWYYVVSTKVIFVGFITSVIALVTHIFIKEIPLRRHNWENDETGGTRRKLKISQGRRCICNHIV